MLLQTRVLSVILENVCCREYKGEREREREKTNSDKNRLDMKTMVVRRKEKESDGGDIYKHGDARLMPQSFSTSSPLPSSNSPALMANNKQITSHQCPQTQLPSERQSFMSLPDRDPIKFDPFGRFIIPTSRISGEYPTIYLIHVSLFHNDCN